MFVASSQPIPEIRNPYLKFYSVNQALQHGFQVPDFILKDKSFDRNDPSFLLTCDSEEHMNELEILKDPSSTDVKYYTKKPYISEITWDFTIERAGQLITYVKELLQTTDEIELWRIWIDETKSATVYHYAIKDFDVTALQAVFGQKYYKKPECIIVHQE